MELMAREKAEALLKRQGIKILPSKHAGTVSEAMKMAEEMGYPIALKVHSPDITHKTDVGGVILNIGSGGELAEAWGKMMSSVRAKAPSARVNGATLQKMFPGSEARELIIGVKTDLQFGHMLVFGLGGIFVEALKDVSFRLVPIERHDACEMLGEIRGKKVLEGFRGQKPVPRKMLEDALLAVSSLVQKNPEIKEMDLNPLLVDHEKALVADFRIFV